MLEAGNKVLISHRRLFANDEPRCFVGEVVSYADGLVKVQGYSFVRDLMQGVFLRKEDLRTKIISISSGSLLVYQLPDDTDVAAVKFETHEAELVLTDGKTLHMNMAEHPHRGQI